MRHDSACNPGVRCFVHKWEMPAGEAAEATEEAVLEGVWSRRRSRSIAGSTAGMWVEFTDPESGVVFYHNKETDQSQWEKPAAIGVHETEQRESWTRRRRSSFQLSEQDAATGWVEQFDPESGSTFWWNEVRGRLIILD